MSTNAGAATTSEPDALLRAVKELTRVVEALQETMKDYPNRKELERDYATRKEIRSRRTAIVLSILVAIVASYFFTVATVSYCFLSGIPKPGTHQYCKIFPGYEDSFNNNRANIQIFVNMQSQIKRNQIEINRLQTEIEQIKK